MNCVIVIFFVYRVLHPVIRFLIMATALTSISILMGSRGKLVAFIIVFSSHAHEAISYNSMLISVRKATMASHNRSKRDILDQVSEVRNLRLLRYSKPIVNFTIGISKFNCSWAVAELLDFL